MHRLFEFFGIFGRHLLALCIQQIAFAVALEHRPEIPAVTVVVGKLGVLQLRVQLPHRRKEIQIPPLASGHRPFRVAVIYPAHFFIAGIVLFLRPHERRIRLIVPHGVTQIGVHEHVGLMHVTHHALAGWNRPGELMADRMAGFVFRDQRILAGAGSPVTMPGVVTTVARITIITIDHMAGSAAGTAIITGLIVGAEEPHQRIIQTGLGNVDHWHGNARTGAGATV